MDKQSLRMQVKNIENNKLLSNVEIWEVVGASTAEDDVEALNERSDEVDDDLEVATEEEQNRIDVA